MTGYLTLAIDLEPVVGNLTPFSSTCCVFSLPSIDSQMMQVFNDYNSTYWGRCVLSDSVFMELLLTLIIFR